MEKRGTLISERQLQLRVIPVSNCIKQGFSYCFFIERINFMLEKTFLKGHTEIAGVDGFPHLIVNLKKKGSRQLTRKS